MNAVTGFQPSQYTNGGSYKPFHLPDSEDQMKLQNGSCISIIVSQGIPSWIFISFTRNTMTEVQFPRNANSAMLTWVRSCFSLKRNARSA